MRECYDDGCPSCGMCDRCMCDDEDIVSAGGMATDAPTRDGSGVETEHAADYGCSSPRVSDVHPAITERSPER